MDFAKLRQLAQTASAPQESASGSLLKGIVKVTVDDYRPDKVLVRASLGKRMFTAEFSADDLCEIRKDPKVEAVSLAEILPLQKLPSKS